RHFRIPPHWRHCMRHTAGPTCQILGKLLEEVFGITNVRSFQLSAKVDDAVTLTVERLVKEDELEKFVRALAEYDVEISNKIDEKDITALGDNFRRFRQIGPEPIVQPPSRNPPPPDGSARPSPPPNPPAKF